MTWCVRTVVRAQSLFPNEIKAWLGVVGCTRTLARYIMSAEPRNGVGGRTGARVSVGGGSIISRLCALPRPPSVAERVDRGVWM